MIRTLYLDKHGTKKTGLTEEEMARCLEHKDCLLWVSLEHPSPEEAEHILHQTFHFHPLAVEDCLNTGYQTPKVDDFGSYLFIIAHAIRTDKSYTQMDTMELNIFLGENYMVSVFLDSEMPSVEALWRRLERDERITQNGSDFLCHSLLDILVDDYMPILDRMDDEIEVLEDQVLEKPTSKTMSRILELKHSLMYLRRVISPQREAVNRLSRDDFPMIDRTSRIYFRDIYDHLVRFQDLADNLRDIVSGAMDIYLNSTSLRLNEIMKALTIVSTIFLPLSFVAGMYGMNFQYIIPSYNWKYGFAFFWLICLGITFGMLAFFKKRGWF
jgi:magnesium transporter